MNYDSDINDIKWKKFDKDQREKKVFTTKCTLVVPYKNTMNKNRSITSILINLSNFSKSIGKWLYLAFKYVFLNSFKIIFLYLLIYIIWLFQNDITSRINHRKKEIEAIIKTSTYHYNINKCNPKTRVPALQKLCSKWECEMNRNIDSVEIINIFATVAGNFIDEFVCKLSYKSIIMFFGFLIVYLIFKKRAN